MNALKIFLVSFTFLAACSMTEPSNRMDPAGCDSVADCSDGDSESVDRCEAATRSCYHTTVRVLPSGCNTNLDCADGNDDSQDLCDVNRTCHHTTVERPAPPPPPPAPDAGPVPEEDAAMEMDTGPTPAEDAGEEECDIFTSGNPLRATGGSPTRPTARRGDRGVLVTSYQTYPTCEGVRVGGFYVGDHLAAGEVSPGDYFERLWLETEDGRMIGEPITLPDHDGAESIIIPPFSIVIPEGTPLVVNVMADVRTEPTADLSFINEEVFGPIWFSVGAIWGITSGREYMDGPHGSARVYIVDREPPSDRNFHFCDEIDPSHPAEEWGFVGCCTDTTFPTAREIPSGSLIKGSGSRVFYLAADGRRYAFPNADTLASWFHEASVPTLRDDGPYVCPRVIQIPDTDLATISFGGNVTFRPGSVITGISADPTRYVITRGAVLRRFALGIIPAEFQTAWPRTDTVHLLPDTSDYVVGADLTDWYDYHARREAGTTIEEELLRVRAAH